jgi:glutamate/tyrosine decarboxylase-like PLP-dependent enzyme
MPSPKEAAKKADRKRSNHGAWCWQAIAVTLYGAERSLKVVSYGTVWPTVLGLRPIRMVVVRDPRHLYAAMAVNAPYLVIGEAREPEHYTPEFSRRARGVEVWAALRSLGRQGLADLIERTCRHATRFAEGLRKAGYDVLNDVVINQVLVSFGEAELTRRVIAAVQADGTCWAGGTVWQGRAAMRISVSSWATTEDDVERSLAAMLRVATEARTPGRSLTVPPSPAPR